jgi:riboflavin kinase/FMN adenylyltransferase
LHERRCSCEAFTPFFLPECVSVPIIRDLDQFPDSARGGAVAIGNFDGVHLGHVRIVERLLQRARELSGPATVFTFDPHPVRILRPEQCPPPLTWTERKVQLLAAHGVDRVVAFPTTEKLLELSAADFFDQIVCKALGAKAMVEGPNFFFGHNREGTIDVLRGLTASAGMSLDIVEPYKLSGQLVSSSLVRQLIAEGNVSAAAQMLSAPYRIRGMVTHGAGRGAKLGFPTANLEAVDTLLPAMGVYAGRVYLEGTSYAAAIHLGPNPTFGEAIPNVEVHVIDFDGALYGLALEVEFVERLREIVAFENEAALVKQLHADIDNARKIGL